MFNRIFSSLKKETPTITLPVNYAIDTVSIPEFVIIDVKSLVYQEFKSNINLENSVKKNGKIIVSFEVHQSNYPYNQNIGWPKSVILSYIDGILLDTDGVDKFQWERQLKINYILDK